ncbi:MAG: aldehyde ferredoxin oxidoreductase N-terminal domain-containing protein [Methanocellales archaeon]|nr:aldehyde ferredoxin oxidoreductase N-terminal domain-containing protein [Methanocellales archaeon]MDD3291520.1 aldehyde ferredoxin oxidoreductase N-terminal domain-containing protein [Methanocellales archaeon]MDD5234590.1 aldehyde ferredoxin oxidoreductase N-terminal domain-containing protein [Methanocellales archaeon]MDD5485057.1 aldehyde ferredoxin oxidoreductase N-terminal domain-containing protein [Methanocellales archaeon]
MSEMYGWAGKVLRADLTNRKVTEEDTKKYSDKFIGGSGIGQKVMWDEVPPEVKAFDPENRIVFTPGVLTGTPSPSSGRTDVMGKSPHTYPKESCTKSGIGGDWGTELKRAGYDGVIVQGKADAPVYLWIKNGEADILDARFLWGLDTYATQHELRRKWNDKQYKMLTIGPAGENLVRYACIMSGTGHSAGQGGFGAVMGSKNLKAVAVRGTGGVGVARPDELLKLLEYVKTLATIMSATPKSILWVDKDIDPHAVNRIPFRYRSTAPGNPGAMAFLKKHWAKEVACASCPIGDYVYCKHPLGSGEIHCMQWYYAWLSGWMDDVAWEVKLLHDKLGINVYELLYMIPWLQKLNEDGVITPKDSGIAFDKWPGRDFIVPLLESIAYRKGFGDTLAEGVPRVAEKLGVLDSVMKEEPKGGASYGGHGMSIHYDARDYIVSGLLWAMDDRDPFHDKHSHIGLVHWSGLSLEEQKVAAEYAYYSADAAQPMGDSKYCSAEAMAAILDQDRSSLKGTLGLCDWVYPIVSSVLEERKYIGDTSVESKLFSAVTGIDTTEADMLKVGERIWNLQRAIMVREGRRREDDTLPDYLFELPAAWGSPPVDREKWEQLKDEYYRLRGWDIQTGIPTKAKMEELGLGGVYEQIAR